MTPSSSQLSVLEGARLAEVFRQAPAFLAVLRGPEHVFELVNDAYYGLIGHRDVVGRPVVDALPEVREQGFVALLTGVLETGVPYIGRETSIWLTRDPGVPPEERFLNFVYQPLVDLDGTRSGVVAHGADVTEQVLARRELEVLNQQLQENAAELEMQTEELRATAEQLEERTEAAEAMACELMDSEIRYRTLAETVPVQVWTAKPDGQLNFVNGHTAAYFEVSIEQLLGDGWGKFVHPGDIAGSLAQWSHALATGTPYETEFRLRSGANGAYRWHLARALPERDAHGTIVGWVGSNTDVENERAARAEAEAANRSKSEFLAVMSHELRTPLNAIGGYAELLELEVQGSITPEQRTFVERIRRSQRHLLGLINGVLNYAKVDAGAVYYTKEEVSLDEVLTTCEALITPQVRAKPLEFHYAGCDTSLMACADREKVQQIVLNLLSNAVKFTEPGGRVTMDCSAADAGMIVVRVADTGRGIPGDQLERVFQPFVQVDAKLTRTQEGTGLGLAISRDLARGMGGDLTVESDVGVGSLFTLVLPSTKQTSA